MTPNVIVVGSANMDLVATTATLPGPGETVVGRDFAVIPGGKGANQAIAAARAGAGCVFVGAVGTDQFGAELITQLRSAGVDVSRVRPTAGPSGVALVAVDDAGENLIVVAPGANATLATLDEADRATIRAASVLVCQLEIPVAGVLAAAGAARSAGVPVILNAAPAQPLPDGLTGLVDLLVVNEHEARVVAGASGDLLSRVPAVVVTLGAAGATYADRTGVRLGVPAPVVSAVDTTAAGNAFTGALAVAWAEHRPLDEALRWACAAGAACARRRGASSALPVRAEIDELYRATYF